MVHVVARKMIERGCTHFYSPGCRSAHGLSFVSNHAGARAYGNGMIGILPSCDAWILNPSLRLRGLMGSNTWRPHQIEENGDHLLPSFYLFATLLRTNRLPISANWWCFYGCVCCCDWQHRKLETHQIHFTLWNHQWKTHWIIVWINVAQKEPNMTTHCVLQTSYTEKPQEPKKLRDHRLFRRMFASKQAATWFLQISNQTKSQTVMTSSTNFLKSWRRKGSWNQSSLHELKACDKIRLIVHACNFFRFANSRCRQQPTSRPLRLNISSTPSPSLAAALLQILTTTKIIFPCFRYSCFETTRAHNGQAFANHTICEFKLFIRICDMLVYAKFIFLQWNNIGCMNPSILVLSGGRFMFEYGANSNHRKERISLEPSFDDPTTSRFAFESVTSVRPPHQYVCPCAPCVPSLPNICWVFHLVNGCVCQ